MPKDRYESPLASRYASAFMLCTCSPPTCALRPGGGCGWPLARAERNLGLPVTAEQVAELEAHITDIDYETASAREKEVRHDVMAHVYTYGKAAPLRRGDHPPGGHQSLCHRQRGSHHLPGGPAVSPGRGAGCGGEPQ